MRIRPPSSSGLNRRVTPAPKRSARAKPSRLPRKETAPMAPKGQARDPRVSYPVHAKVMPMARASMLVATANTVCVLRLRGSKDFFSSFLKASRIIFPPRKSRMPKAIQWSYASMYVLNRLVRNHPISGIRAWKNPNRRAVVNTGRVSHFPSNNPHTMDTVKQSIASATAMRRIPSILQNYDFGPKKAKESSIRKMRNI